MPTHLRSRIKSVVSPIRVQICVNIGVISDCGDCDYFYFVMPPMNPLPHTHEAANKVDIMFDLASLPVMRTTKLTLARPAS